MTKAAEIKAAATFLISDLEECAEKRRSWSKAEDRGFDAIDIKFASRLKAKHLGVVSHLGRCTPDGAGVAEKQLILPRVQASNAGPRNKFRTPATFSRFTARNLVRHSLITSPTLGVNNAACNVGFFLRHHCLGCVCR